MVLNDAAGEGVNLQRGAHLMVNYYLPWNPVRIEQRFGRVHQIAQTELCHLWNLCEDVILICRRKFVEYLNPKSGCKTSCLAECSSVVEQLAISSSASTFAVACQDGTIRLWDVGAILQRGGTIGDYVARQARTVGRRRSAADPLDFATGRANAVTCNGASSKLVEFPTGSITLKFDDIFSIATQVAFGHRLTVSSSLAGGATAFFGSST